MVRHGVAQRDVQPIKASDVLPPAECGKSRNYWGLDGGPNAPQMHAMCVCGGGGLVTSRVRAPRTTHRLLRSERCRSRATSSGNESSSSCSLLETHWYWPPLSGARPLPHVADTRGAALRPLAPAASPASALPPCGKGRVAPCSASIKLGRAFSCVPYPLVCFVRGEVSCDCTRRPDKVQTV